MRSIPRRPCRYGRNLPRGLKTRVTLMEVSSRAHSLSGASQRSSVSGGMFGSSAGSIEPNWSPAPKRHLPEALCLAIRTSHCSGFCSTSPYLPSAAPKPKAPSRCQAVDGSRVRCGGRTRGSGRSGCAPAGLVGRRRRRLTQSTRGGLGRSENGQAGGERDRAERRKLERRCPACVPLMSHALCLPVNLGRTPPAAWLEPLSLRLGSSRCSFRAERVPIPPRCPFR